MEQDNIIAVFKSVLTDSSAQRTLSAYHPNKGIPLEALGLTSLQMVEISMELEEKFGLDIDLEDFESIGTFSEFVEMCRANLARQ